MKHDVFISYKRMDNVVANAIAHMLKSNDISCWHDRELDFHDAGSNYANRIVEIIKEVKIVVVLLSDEALNSPWVNMEVNTALDYNKHIIPFVIRDLNVENGLSRLLKQIHWIDAYPNPDKKFNLLLNNIKLEMNKIIKASKDTEDVRCFNIDVNLDYENDFDFEEGEVLYQAGETVDAIRSFLISAENGNPKAKSRLCEIFCDTEDIDRLISADLWNSIEKLAKEGHCYANFMMHTKYYKVTDSGLISFEYLKKALKNGPIAEAFLRLGIHYGWGLGVKPNHILAIHYYEKALQMGKTSAYGYLGSAFESGSDKFVVDTYKALEYYKKGAAAKDKRSLQGLYNFYIQEGEHRDIEKAKSYAQATIEYGFNVGYVWMGNIYRFALNDDIEAKKWYTKAAAKDVKGAFSALAELYWNEGKKDIAYKWAQKGVANRDSSSYAVLGWLYENDKDQYDEAWKYYKEGYDLFGSRAGNLARLYLEKGYRPKAKTGEKEYDLEDLIHSLEVCARNSDEYCLNYLIKIYTYPDQFHLNINPDLQKAREYEKIGVHLGLTDHIYQMGLRCLDKDDEKNYNPYKGIEYLEECASKQHIESIHKLLEIYDEDGIEPKPAMFDKWCDFAIVNRLASHNDKRFQHFLDKCISLNAEFKVEYCHYIYYILKNRQDIDPVTKAYLSTLFVKGYHIESCQKDEDIYTDVIKDIRREIEILGNFAFAREILNYVYPDFDYKGLENGTVELTEEALKKYYIMRSSQYEVNIPKQQSIWECTSMRFRSSDSFEKICEKKLGIADNKYWENFPDKKFSIFENYEKICAVFGLEPIEPLTYTPDRIFPSPSPVWLTEFREYIVRTMLQLIRHGVVPFDTLSITNTDIKLLETAEANSDKNEIFIYLVAYVEAMIETDMALQRSYTMMCDFKKGEYLKFIDTANRYIEKLSKSGIDHDIKNFEESEIKNAVDGFLQTKNKDVSGV